MAAVSQTTLSNAFSWMKMLEFQLRFHWSLFLRVQLTIIQHWFRYWLGAGQATSHYLNRWWLVYWRIYASLGLNELNGCIGVLISEPSWHAPCQDRFMIWNINTYIPRKFWWEIAYPLSNFSGVTVAIPEWIRHCAPHRLYNVINK